MAPFITSVKGNKVNLSHIRDVDPKHNDTARLIPQILGTDPHDFLLLASTFSSMGYRSVNWNIGCPYPMVARKKRGCGLMPYPDRIDSFLNRVIPEMKCPLSVKVRLGLHSPAELETLLPVFNRYPLEEIIIHARTGDQMYEGLVDLRSFGALYHEFKMPVVYNGDIMSYVNYHDLTLRYPDIHRWMLGRGVLRNPLLIPSIRSGKELLDPDKIRRFHDNLFRKYEKVMPTRGHLLGKMKGLWFYMGSLFTGREKEIRIVLKSTKVADYENSVKSVFSNT